MNRTLQCTRCKKLITEQEARARIANVGLCTDEKCQGVLVFVDKQ